MLSQAPTMADPSRWKTLMYEAFWLGKEPELTPEEQKARREHTAQEARAAIGSPVARSDLAAMDELLARAAQLREESDK